MSRITKVKITGLHIKKSKSTVTFNCADLAIQQDFSPSWKAEQAYGKMDPIMAYSHTGRKANFDMVLLATTLADAMSLQFKVDRLIKLQYPRYTGGRLAAPPFFKVSALDGRLYSTLRGAMDSIKIIPGSTQDVVPLVNSRGNFFERKYQIQFVMTVLHHNMLPGWVGTVEPGGTGNRFVFKGQVAAAPATAKKSPGTPAGADDPKDDARGGK